MCEHEPEEGEGRTGKKGGGNIEQIRMVPRCRDQALRWVFTLNMSTGPERPKPSFGSRTNPLAL